MNLPGILFSALAPGRTDTCKPMLKGAVVTRKLPRKARALGFTFFELIVVIVVVALFSGMLANRFLIYREMAEKVAMEQVVGAIRSALNIQLAGMISKGHIEDAPKLVNTNPFNFLVEKMKNYAGEYDDAADVPAGNWYYDLKNRQVVYLVQYGAHFVPDRQGNKSVRFKAALVYNDALFDASDESSRKEVGGVAFREVEPYSWSIKR